jgi:hypothetical protein
MLTGVHDYQAAPDLEFRSDPFACGHCSRTASVAESR